MSTEFVKRAAIVLCAAWAVLACIIYGRHGLDGDVIIPAIALGWALIWLATFGLKWVMDASPQKNKD